MRPRFLPIVAGALGALAALGTACGPKRIAGPSRPGKALVALLPDADTGKTGRALVSSGERTVDLAAAGDATVATTNGGPGPVTTLSKADVDRFFGEALAALPRAPGHFTLYFRFESNQLTDESRALVPAILRAVKDRTDPEVAIVGHTDTMGSPAANVELGLKRAKTVRTLLVNAGLDPKVIDVTSHGEGNPLVRTADDTPEPRNRRVEISVR
jgi:outer membrane protein OmpA-like peptidoglycan-associated protein